MFRTLCTIAAKTELPIIPLNEEKPSFTITRFEQKHREVQRILSSVESHFKKRNVQQALSILQSNVELISEVLAARLKIESWLSEHLLKQQFSNSLDCAVAGINRFAMGQVFKDDMLGLPSPMHLDEFKKIDDSAFNLYPPALYAFDRKDIKSAGMFVPAPYGFDWIALRVGNNATEYDIYQTAVHEVVHMLSKRTAERLGLNQRSSLFGQERTVETKTAPFNEAWTDIIKGLIIKQNFDYTKGRLAGHPKTPAGIRYGYEPEMAIAKGQLMGLKSVSMVDFINAMFSDLALEHLKEKIKHEKGSYDRFSQSIYDVLYK